MYIKSLKISNILSFPYLEDFDGSKDTITFDPQTNILIGANGSGKSNLIEVISRLWKQVFFINYELKDEAFNPNPQVKYIQRASFNISNTLYKNNKFLDKPSQVEIDIGLTAVDKENVKWIFNHKSELEELIEEYSNESLFEVEADISLLDSLEEIKFRFVIENSNKYSNISFSLNRELSPIENVIYIYLSRFNLLQKLIETGIYYKNKEWELLKNTYALIPAIRQYQDFSYDINIAAGINNNLNSITSNEIQVSAKRPSSPESIFAITNFKLATLFRRYSIDSGDIKAIEKLQNDKNLFLYKINKYLQSELGFKLNFKERKINSDVMKAEISNTAGEVIDFESLSTGQKSIFHLIFALWGYDLKNALIVIDEPELHLHPSLQKVYFELLLKAQKDLNIQVIVATHSSMFINEITINNTFKASKDLNGNTEFFRPETIDIKDKELLRILTYTNSSKIFFANVVVLVEGDSDEYFFRYFYENFYKLQKTDFSSVHLEFLNIGGKYNYAEKWKPFLEKFKIKHVFITDLDYLKQIGLESDYLSKVKGIIENNFDSLSRKVREDVIEKSNSLDAKTLLSSLNTITQKNSVSEITEEDFVIIYRVWNYILEKHIPGKLLIEELRKDTALWNKIETNIEAKSSDNIFILKEGDLEGYLGLENKGLDKVINFCNSNFDTWKTSETTKVEEIKKIFEKAESL